VGLFVLPDGWQSVRQAKEDFIGDFIGDFTEDFIKGIF